MWILFSILAALCWAVANIVDKYVLDKWVRQPIIPVIILGIVSLIASIVVYFTYGFSFLSQLNIFLTLVAGIFYILTQIFYFKALKIEEVSRVVPLFYLSPLIISFFAAIFLGEIFTLFKYLGIILIVMGAVLISSKNFFKINFSKSFWFMILAAFFISINAIMTKYLLNFADYWTIFAYTRMGVVIGLIPIAYIYFPELINTVKTHGKRVIALISANETLNMVGILLATIAISIGYVTLVNALTSIYPLFIFIFALILSLFYPQILKEKIERPTVILKLIAIILIFIGAILIT